MMYITGNITCISKDKPIYICNIKTPGIHIMEHSYRSWIEAMIEALKEIGLPL